MNIQRNMKPTKETNKALMTDLNEMEIYEMFDKEFRIFFKINSVNYKETQIDK